MRMNNKKYVIKTINSHVEVFDDVNRFLFSADNEQEAMHDINEMYE